MRAPTLRGKGLRYNLQNARVLYEGLKEAGIDFVTYLPDTWLREVYKLIIADKEIKSIAVTSEDEGMAIAAGAFLAGKKPAVIMEGSGFGNSAGVLARFALVRHIPWLIISSHTGSIPEFAYYHSEERYLTEPLLRAMGIPFYILRNIEEAKRVLREAQFMVEGQVIPVAVLISGGLLWEGY